MCVLALTEDKTEEKQRFLCLRLAPTAPTQIKSHSFHDLDSKLIPFPPAFCSSGSPSHKHLDPVRPSSLTGKEARGDF